MSLANAINKNDLQTVNKLLTQGIKPNKQDLTNVVNNNNLNMAKLIIPSMDNKIINDNPFLFIRTINENKIDIANILLKYINPNIAIQSLVSTRDIKTAVYLINNGYSNYNINDILLLLLSTPNQIDPITEVKYLFSGCPNAQPCINVQYHDNDAIQWAAKSFYPWSKTVKFLLEQGANPNVNNKNALRWAEKRMTDSKNSNPDIYNQFKDIYAMIRNKIYSPDNQAQKLKIITFNLAYAVQANVISGSEKLLVQLCQQTYKGGDSNIEGLSQCTLNAGQWLARQNADLIGLQEIGDKYYIQKMLTVFPKGYETIRQSPQTVYFIYNKNKLGSGTIISPPNLNVGGSGRPMLVVWFAQIKLLAINLHAAHKINLKQTIENSFNSITIPAGVKPNRIIITGDFNDTYNAPLSEINIMGKLLKQHGPPPKSCCIDTDTKYQFPGDYIFDSDYQQAGFYGVPDDAKTPVLYNGNKPYVNSNSKNKLMSDHEPVVFYSY